MSLKKIRNEAELLKEAIRVGSRYFEARGAGKFEATDHIDLKTRAIYLLLVKDKVIQPLAAQHQDVQNMRHKLAIWISKNLPQDHHLLK
ncbi:MAG: DUF5062 family protein [Gammaproteobacteria bacterium]|jgi:hypothetical protein|nr:DUF5062 family protein [Gammaproteobacteria bacterium]